MSKQWDLPNRIGGTECTPAAQAEKNGWASLMATGLGALLNGASLWALCQCGPGWTPVGDLAKAGMSRWREVLSKGKQALPWESDAQEVDAQGAQEPWRPLGNQRASDFFSTRRDTRGRPC